MRLPLHGRLRKILLIMKLTTLILITVILHVSATSLAQKVTLKEKNVPLVDVFNQISAQTGYDFAFTSEALKNAKPVTINVTNEELKDALNQLFQGQNLDFSLDNKIVVIKPKETSFFDNLKNKIKEAVAAVDVHGRLVDDNNQPLAGATVTVKNTGNSTATDLNGYFYLHNVDPNATILITFIGFDSKELSAKADLGIIKLSPASSKLDEVQVIAYGRQTERLSVGNVTTIKGSTIEKQPVNNPLLALEGQVPGLFITQNSGLSGAYVTPRIQGQNSISNGNEPFVVIDGVPYATQSLSPTSSGGPFGLVPGGTSPLAYINPSDIESISVLKDGDATAIYGSRAANGAIVITTKKGKAGETQINFGAQQGWGKVTKMLDLMNTDQYLAMRFEALKNDGIASPSATDYDINGVWDKTRNTNWQKELIGGTAQYADYNANVSGGSVNTQYLVSSAYHRETTVFPGSLADKRASVHFNLHTVSTNQKFNFTVSGSYVSDNNPLPAADPTAQAIKLAPDAPAVYNSDGSINWAPDASGKSTFSNNPMAYLLNTYDRKTNNLISSSSISYQILPGLEIKTDLGFNNLQTNEVTLNPAVSSKPETQLSSGNAARRSVFTNSTSQTWIIEPELTYSKNIAKGKLNFLLGTTIQQSSAIGNSLGANTFSSDALIADPHSAGKLSVGTSLQSQYKYNALFGRIAYNWDNKYLLDISARRDGSSRFGPENQFHNFGAIGAGWIFTEESVIKNKLPFLSFGKLTASYGLTGNDQIGDYKFLSLYAANTVQLPYQGIPVISPTGLPNPYLQWETTKKMKAGLDLGFLKDRILLNVTYSKNRSSNELIGFPLSSVTGYFNIIENLPALVQNTSWEFSVNSTNIKAGSFKWTSSINLTIPRNILLQTSVSNFLPTSLIPGQPLGAQQVFHFLGVDPATGLFQFTNSQGKPTVNPVYLTDRNTIVNPAFPKYYGGFNNAFVYKNFSLDFTFQFTKQIKNNFLFGNAAGGAAFVNNPVALTNRWQKPGDVAQFMRYNSNYTYAYSWDNANTSDAAYSDASYIRLKNLMISFQLPNQWIQKAGFKSFSLNLQGQNLITITKYLGVDPESGFSSTIPPLKVITLGVKAGL